MTKTYFEWVELQDTERRLGTGRPQAFHKMQQAQILEETSSIKGTCPAPQELLSRASICVVSF